MSKFLVLSVLVCAVAAAHLEPGDGSNDGCPPYGWTYSKVTGLCYKYEEFVTAGNLEDYCSGSNPRRHVASIHNAFANSWIADYLARQTSLNAKYVFIGLNATTNPPSKRCSYSWTDGSNSTSYENFDVSHSCPQVSDHPRTLNTVISINRRNTDVRYGKWAVYDGKKIMASVVLCQAPVNDWEN